MRSQKAVSDSDPFGCLNRPQRRRDLGGGVRETSRSNASRSPMKAGQEERMPPNGDVAASLGEVRDTRGGPLVCHVRDELPSRVSSAGWETRARVRRHNGRTRSQIGRASAGAAEPAHARGVPLTHRRTELETAPNNRERAATEPVANAFPQDSDKQTNERSPQRHRPRVIPFRGRLAKRTTQPPRRNAAIQHHRSRKPNREREDYRGSPSPRSATMLRWISLVPWPKVRPVLISALTPMKPSIGAQSAP